jgi:NADP-dependent aldehyde dehydrogenase
VELPRTTHQLRQAAHAARNGSWARATIDTKNDIRSVYEPLGGPVLVFGPNNFPFAFNSVAGGDFAAAVAAGNPVIAKANPAHPGTTLRLAECAFAALQDSGLHPASVQMLYHLPPELGLEFVAHPAIGATGFTGSRSAGLRLKEAADRAGKPIYLELSSVNPLLILPGALKERGAAIAQELYESCALGGGQFCTRPGLTLVVKGAQSDAFVEALAARFEQGTPGTLLAPNGADALEAAVNALLRAGATLVRGGQRLAGPRFAFENTLLRVSGTDFLASPGPLQHESFGTVNLIVEARDAAELEAILVTLEGNLTGTIYSATDGSDDSAYARLAPLLRARVGRLLNDKMPTGVAVSPAMNHGGPYPATGHPGFTAVGIPAALLRFAALRCYDNVRPERLPNSLKDRNPTGTMWRLLDGEWSQADVTS